MPETRQEETGRKRASRKVPAVRNASVIPSRRPTTRPGEQVVSPREEEVIAKEVLGEERDWVGQVSYVLFVLRQMPHSDSGFSPSDLVYGFRVGTPLDTLYHGLFEVEREVKCV